MKKIKLFMLGLITALTFGLASCGEKKDDAVYKLNHESLNMIVGDIESLELLKNDIVLTDGITWSSDNNDVAVVKNGSVKAVSKGTANIEAKVNDKSVKCVVTVSLKPSYKLSMSDILVEVNGEAKLTLQNNGEEVTSGVAWSSKDTDVATVDGGKIKGVSAGECNIVAIFEGKSYTANVVVVEGLNPVVGKYHSKIMVAEMDNRVFEFDIELKSDNSYTYFRYDSVLDGDKIEGGMVSEGTWTYENARLTLKDSTNTINLLATGANSFKSDGEIITGGVEAALTFKRVEA